MKNESELCCDADLLKTNKQQQQHQQKKKKSFVSYLFNISLITPYKNQAIVCVLVICARKSLFAN